MITQVQSQPSSQWVFSRNNNTDTAGFDITLQREENFVDLNGSETVGWLAIEPAVGTWSGDAYSTRRTTAWVDAGLKTLSFNTSISTPRFLADLSSVNGADPSRLRRQGLNTTTVKVKIEEDTTCNSEMGHADESISFLALGGTGLLYADPN